MEHLSRDQVVALLTVARESKPNGTRNWVLFLVSFWHGLRASEAVALTPGNFTDGYLDVQRLKGSMRTVQPLVEHDLEILNERAAVESYLAEHKKHLATSPEGSETHSQPSGAHKRADLLFPISRVQFFRLMRRCGRAAGIPRHLCHPHVLKHSIAMQSIGHAGIENVRQYLGHRSISSTGAYLRVSDDAASRAVTSPLSKSLS